MTAAHAAQHLAVGISAAAPASGSLSVGYRQGVGKISDAGLFA